MFIGSTSSWAVVLPRNKVKHEHLKHFSETAGQILRNVHTCFFCDCLLYSIKLSAVSENIKHNPRMCGFIYLHTWKHLNRVVRLFISHVLKFNFLHYSSKTENHKITLMLLNSNDLITKYLEFYKYITTINSG